MSVLFLIVLIVAFIQLIPKRAASEPSRGIIVSRGDYHSHLDFLAAHGAITEEELEAQHSFERELRLHPERFRRVTLGELLAETEAEIELTPEGQ